MTLQPEYNLICRSAEWELLKIAERDNLAVLAWSPLAGICSSALSSSNQPFVSPKLSEAPPFFFVMSLLVVLSSFLSPLFTLQCSRMFVFVRILFLFFASCPAGWLTGKYQRSQDGVCWLLSLCLQHTVVSSCCFIVFCV